MGVALRHFEMNMASVGPKFHDLDKSPYPGFTGLRHGPGYIAQQAGQGNALLAGRRKRRRLVHYGENIS